MMDGVANVPIRRVTRDRGVHLEGVNGMLGRGIVTRSTTVSGIIGSVRHGHVKLGSPGRPVNIFVFLNPANIKGACLTGGLTRRVFNSTSTLFHVSVDRCTRKFGASQLVNSPPKCINCSRNKRLARGMHHGPCDVILLSRVRGTGARIFGLLLRMVSRKELASKGNHLVSFHGAVVVVASGTNAQRLGRFNENMNFGTNKVNDGKVPVSRGSGRCTHDIVRGRLSGRFTPRFLGHLSRVVAFSRLSLPTVADVMSLRLGSLMGQVRGLNCRFRVASGTGRFMTDGKCSIRFNTHPLGQTVRGCIRSKLYRLLVRNGLGPKSIVDVKGGPGGSRLAFGGVVGSWFNVWGLASKDLPIGMNSLPFYW